jgi:hypothetical protein
VVSAAAAASAAAAPPVLPAALAFDAGAPLFRTWASYLSFNIDTASLTNSLDFTDPVFTTLVAQLVAAGGGAPTQVRIGGGTADAACYTGAGGPAGNCSVSPVCTTCINDAYFASIAAWVAATGADLVWDLSAMPRGAGGGGWDPANAAAFVAHVQAAGVRVAAWQLGNEPELWPRRNITANGTALGGDVRAVAALLPPGTPILGPSACCDATPDFLLAYLAAAGDALTALDFHIYPIGRALPNKTCELGSYYNVSAWRAGLERGLAAYAATRDAGRPGLPLVLGETATSADGGCADFSNRFIAGGEFMYTLGRAAEMGVSQVNRQDIVGFSGPTEPSQYALAGPPGWASGSAALAGAVHPDYFVALLWRQVVGLAVLAATLAPPPETAGNLDAHVWCAAPGAGVGAGGVVVTFTNYANVTVALAAVGALPSAPRVEFILTSAPAGAPPCLNCDAALLNGAPLAVDATGHVALPLPGAPVAAGGGAILLPPMSFGFVALPGPVAACA